MDIDGSTALVTGSNRGIGRAITEELASRGARVLAGVRVLDGDHAVAPGASISAVRIDLSSREAIEASAADLGDVPIDILVNNAGVFEGGLLERHDVARIYELLQSTLVGPIHLTRLLLPGMLRRGRGKVVNNASIIGHAPFPAASVYAAAKTGLHGFTESVRTELHDSGVSVLELVTPGIDTDMMSQVQDQLREHVNTDGWDHVEPGDWAEKVADAIESDEDQLNPGGAERLAALLPRTLREFGIRHLFSR